ncbi:TetR/AcrR family transcriptional regulator [Jatrophihabitans sp. YIM 134969]
MTSSEGTRAARRAETARRILAAAREEFGRHGYEATTVRAVAARAGVDPSLVMQHHGSKAALFTSAIQWDDADADDVETHLQAVVDKRLAGLPPEMTALVRSMLTVPEATASMREYLDDRVTNLARGLGGEDAELRAALTVSSLLGLTLARHFLHLQAFEDASDDDLTRVARAWIAQAAGTPATPRRDP